MLLDQLIKLSQLSAQMFTTDNLTITGILIFITIGLSIYAEENPIVKKKWIFNPYSISKYNEYARFLTSGFIHNGYIHMGVNMYVFYSFGGVLERIFSSPQVLGSYGPIAYPIFYLLAIIVSGIPSYFKHRHKIHYNALGASGGVSAVVFAFVLFFPLNRIGIIFLPPQFSLPGFVVAILYLFYTIYMSRRQDQGYNDRIGHDAHLYGALFGIVFSIVIYPPVLSEFIKQISNWEGFFLELHGIMNDSQLIRIFEKQIWKKEAILIIHVIIISVLGAFSLYMLGCGLFLLCMYLLNLNWRSYSVLKMHEHYMICYNYLVFWKRKKLFDYKKVRNISIYRITGKPFCTLKIHYSNGNIYTYCIESEQIDHFKYVLRKCGLDQHMMIF